MYLHTNIVEENPYSELKENCEGKDGFNEASHVVAGGSAL
ncbi:hypothetical protein SiRe_1478 [Sulfolobus islandicus REY15A]|uniref:Uncharacterized protein n=1 Tax=Saccharolobus islandicus (strain REY15A) TaxID=930945 RepID=F0NBK5_SACI5|nr:hypothetical protein SiRe_1478 [Sulfolobus islandicus REY15A]